MPYREYIAKMVQEMLSLDPEVPESIERIREAYEGRGFYGFIDDFTLMAVSPEEVARQEAEIIMERYAGRTVPASKERVLCELKKELEQRAEVLEPAPLKDPLYVKIGLFL